MGFKQFVKSILFGSKSSSERYVKHLRSKGMCIGEGTTIYSPNRCIIDETRPWMIEMGRNVQITEGVTLLTHGYDWSVIKAVYGDILGSAGKIKIGDNVFIGVNSTILKGVTVGDNVIIGANTLITKDVPSNSVVAGNPQRIISSLEDYYKKRLSAQLDEAFELYAAYISNSPAGLAGGLPPKDIFHEFFWLFEARGDNGFDFQPYEEKMNLMGTYELSVKRLGEYRRPFETYEDFISALNIRLNN